MIQIGKILKSVPIFKMLGKESIDFIVERLKFKTFSANQVICKIGDPGSEMFIIISGQVKICIYSDGGKKEQVVANLGPGNYFGEMALLTGETRSASVIAEVDSEMFVLHKNDFDIILEKYPSITLSMGKIFSQRLKDTLSKASQMPDIQKIDTTKNGPSGNIKDVPLVDLINFCESNSLSGTMVVRSDGKEGVFEFLTGRLESVKLGEISDDAALDKMLGWPEGVFEIQVNPLKIGREEQEAGQEPKNILIVNNSLVVRKIVERAFKGLGYNVETAQHIADAMDLLSGFKADVIISDIKLADGSGNDFAEQAREKGEIPFIFIGDHSVKPESEKAIRAIGNSQLTKTHEVSEIVKLVENLI